MRSARLRFSLLAFVLGCYATAAVADVPPPDQDGSPLTPEKIYLRSVHAMKAVPEPAFVTFRETVSGRNFTLRCTKDGTSLFIHHGDVTATYDVWFRTSDGSALSRRVDDAKAEECPAALLTPAGSTISSLGVVQASPSPGAAAATPDEQAGPPLVGAVHVEAAAFYHIELAGLEQLGGNDVYHLKLKAYREPTTHPLTDLYVDRNTFLVREARGEVSGHYVLASGRVAGVVDFDRVGPYWLVEHEHFDVAANALLVHARLAATVDGSNFATPDELPDIAFPAPPAVASPRGTPAARV
jgi:hypothetical protein